jgi:glycosyltransferase involved in cell wall biosynthesis
MKPLVSILIPAFNAQELLTDTLASAIAQSWVNKEIVVVDDGSTDQTLAVARGFASKSVSVITQENQGAAAARNKAFSLCQGDYIQWLDADDLLSGDKITRQMEARSTCPTDRFLLSSGWGYFMYRPRKAKFTPTPLWNDLTPAEWLIRKIGQNLHMQTATWLVSRKLTEAAGPWDTRLLGDDDGEYFCRVLLASDGVRFVPEAKVFYRLTGQGSLSQIGRSNKKIQAQFVSMQLHIRYLRSLEDSARARAACVTYLQNWAIHFFPDRLDILEEARKLAAELGGHLEPPRLSWKYAWIQRLFGWGVARRVQILAPNLKWSLGLCVDKILSRIEGSAIPDI